MALIRWDPQDMDRFREDMTRFWTRMRDDWNLDQTKPRTHLHAIENGYLVEFELPGVDPDAVSMEVDEKSISVRGQFPGTPAERDRRIGDSFHATVTLPSEINPDSAEAQYRHGLLSLKVTKSPGRRRRIQINAGVAH
ncbi:MAG: Hsp20/alpha crystallin family protein [Thermaerobacter sp.]|nr:Hsp20/alpha crystallin family protein [Thermaerobacter sp.]